MKQRSAASAKPHIVAAAPTPPSLRIDPQQLGLALLQWFAVHHRDLPWRVRRNPYRIWISEVMLQQTRVETVIPYYERFLEAFPTVTALAEAPEADVLKLWEGLGYYSRARNLHRAAKEIVERFGGELPRTPEQLRTLPGIGRYTAGAIASIAFNEPVPAVDGNVLRVVARLAGITDLITKAAVQRRIEQHVADMIPPGRAGLMTEALMELGALVCLPRAPLCERCPWQDACIAKAKGVAAELPKRPRRTPPRLVTGAVAVVRRGNAVLVTQRPEEGLLAGMWEFPWVEAHSEAAEELLRDALRQRHGIDVRIVGQLPPIRHVFSHLQWELLVFECEAVEELRVPLEDARAVAEVSPPWPATTHLRSAEDSESNPEPKFEPARGPNTKWVTPARLQQLPFGRAHRRIAAAWLTRGEAAGQGRLFGGD